MADRQQRMSTQSVSWEVEETDDPISGRITQVDESTIKLPGGTTIEYGAVSLRGYYPDDPEKANQDSHVCIADFNAAAKNGANGGGGEPLLKRSFFGVFDGHGACGGVGRRIGCRELRRIARRHTCSFDERSSRFTASLSRSNSVSLALRAQELSVAAADGMRRDSRVPAV